MTEDRSVRRICSNCRGWNLHASAWDSQCTRCEADERPNDMDRADERNEWRANDDAQRVADIRATQR